MLSIEGVPFEQLLQGTKTASNKSLPWWSFIFSTISRLCTQISIVIARRAHHFRRFQQTQQE
jgi:hypothetical protein